MPVGLKLEERLSRPEMARRPREDTGLLHLFSSECILAVLYYKLSDES